MPVGYCWVHVKISEKSQVRNKMFHFEFDASAAALACLLDETVCTLAVCALFSWPFSQLLLAFWFPFAASLRLQAC
jgi:hypothetical protein